MSITAAKRRKRTFRKPKHEHSWSINPTDNKSQYFRAIWKSPADILLPVFPFCIEEEIRVGEYWYKDNYTRYFLVVICLQGDICFEFAEEEIILASGQVLIVPQGIGYTLRNADTVQSHKVVIELIGNNLTSDLETLGLNKVIVLKMKEYQKLAATIREIGNLVDDGNKNDIPLIVGLTYRLCCELSLFIHQTNPENTLLQQAQMLLESNFDKKLTLSMLSQDLDCSESFLGKLFRRKLGTSPMQYRQEKRIACARYLLCSTTLTVKEIAYKLGYCDPFYFSNEFRRITGESPTQARRGKTLI